MTPKKKAGDQRLHPQRRAFKLAIVADPAAGMACVPFAALLDEEDRDLIQRFTISAAPSLGALLHLAQRPDHSMVPLGESDSWREELRLRTWKYRNPYCWAAFGVVGL
eukprot:scaffold748_cov251-Pinguiococcus_pyrenoidosus.AAC.6